MNDGHIRDMNLHEVVPARPSSQLTHSLDKRHALDITHGASQLNYAHIRLLARVIDGYPRHLLDPVLNRIGNVWHNLHRLAQIVALALALDNVAVDFARRDVVIARQRDVEVALVVAEIEVDFAAVGEDEYFAVPVVCLVTCHGGIYRRLAGLLLRVHRPCVDIEVRVDLDRRDVLGRQYAS